MPQQQQNHNTAAGDDIFPFDWQLDQIHWRPAPVRRRQLSAEAAPFEPARQPEGEYIPPFNLPLPLEPICDTPSMFAGSPGPPQSRRISIGTQICPHDAIYRDPEPLFCHGAPYEGPPGFIGCPPGLPPQPGHWQSGQERFAPHGPPPPTPFFFPFHPMFFPPPPMFDEPGWFLAGPGPGPCPSSVFGSPHTPGWDFTCNGPFSPLPNESPFMVGASGPPPRPRNWSAPPSYGPQDPESDTWVTIPSPRTPTSSVFGEPYYDACEVIGRRPAPVEQTREPNYNLRIANVAIWLTAQEGQTEEPESDIWGEISCPDGPDEQSEEAESDTSSVVFFLDTPPPRALEELERARRSSPRG